MLAVSSLPPVQGIDELVAALAEHRAGLDLVARRLEARRTGALADFVAEHGSRGLRGLGGRQAALELLSAQDPGLDVAALVAVLEQRARPRMARDLSMILGAFVAASLLAGRSARATSAPRSPSGRWGWRRRRYMCC